MNRLRALPKFLMVGSVALLPLFAFADVQNLQQILKSHHATWTAKDSWITQLPEQDLHRLLGVKGLPDTSVEFSPSAQMDRMVHAALPPSIDWRNKDGVNWVSPVLNQGNCGSCVAFASVATLETQVNITSGIPGLNPSFSAQALFSCGGGSCDAGWQPGEAANFLKGSGVPDEACLPYTSGATGQDVACSAVCSNAASRSTKIVTFHRPTWLLAHRNAVKQALLQGPLVTTLTVYADFMAYASGVYKHVTGGVEGGHAVSIVGYDDTKNAWLIRNSWSADWGEGGFAWVSYDDVSGIGNNTILYTVPTQKGYVSVQNPHGRQFESGRINVQAESTYAGTSSIELDIVAPSGATVKSTSCTGAPCSVMFDTTSIPDGAYQIFAVAKSSTGDALATSEHEQFFVANSAPHLSLSFQSDGSFDLSKPLSGRPVFNVTSSTGIAGVPLSSINFHAVQNGKEIYNRSTGIAFDQMTVGWRTTTGPNGNYEIWFSGELATAGGQTATVESNHLQISVQN